MEKVARRTNVKTPPGSYPLGTKEVLQSPLPRGSSRRNLLCRQIGFLLVFVLCSLFTYYVAVVRLQPPRQAGYMSKLPFFHHSKHLKQESDDAAEKKVAFSIPSVDWHAQDFRSWLPWQKHDSKSRLEAARLGAGDTADVLGKETGQLGGEGKTGGIKRGRKTETEKEKGGGLQRQEMEGQLERGLSQSTGGDATIVPGKQTSRGEADVAVTSAPTERPRSDGTTSEHTGVNKGVDADVALTSAPTNDRQTERLTGGNKGADADVALTSAPLFRGARKDDRTAVLKFVVEELEKQAEANKQVADQLVADEQAAQGQRTELGGESKVEGGSKLESGSKVDGGGKEAVEATGPKRKKRKKRKFNAPRDLYAPISTEGYHPCVERDAEWTVPPAVEGRGYFYPGLDGGLSQQIFEITNAVAVARILNVTLVVPQLGFDPYWKDGSNFSTIFDLDHFRQTLADDIRVITVPELPENMQNEYFWKIIDRLPYGREDEYVTKFWDSFSPNQVTKSYSFFTALDMWLRPPLEKLRCRAKYEALRFHPQIVSTAKRLVDRMRERANGPFLALHLRFETDMVMYSARCEYGIDDPEERKYWDAQREERAWPKPESDDAMRSQGRCPATPGEVGRWLQAMGFNETTQVYLASGAIYHEDVFMPAFLDMFPNTFRKDDLFTAEEAALLKGKNNILAGIDFEVLANADVTAVTFHGMMKASIQGHRNWLGFRKTLHYPLMESQSLRNLPWKEFKVAAKRATQLGRPQSRAGVEVMGNPVPDCMCQGR